MLYSVVKTGKGFMGQEDILASSIVYNNEEDAQNHADELNTLSAERNQEENFSVQESICKCSISIERYRG